MGQWWTWELSRATLLIFILIMEELLCRLFNYADGQVNVNLVLLKQNRGANALNAQCFATRLNTLIHVQWTRFHERAALLRLKVSLSHYKMH